MQDGIPGFIRKSELSRDRSEQRPDRYAIGDKLEGVVSVEIVDGKITNFYAMRNPEKLAGVTVSRAIGR